MYLLGEGSTVCQVRLCVGTSAVVYGVVRSKKYVMSNALHVHSGVNIKFKSC